MSVSHRRPIPITWPTTGRSSTGGHWVDARGNVHADFVTHTFKWWNCGGTSSWKQTTGNYLLLQERLSTWKRKRDGARGGIGKREGPYLATSISTLAAKTKGRTKGTVSLELLGELAQLFSALRVGIKDLSANNSFQYSLCNFPLLSPVMHILFCGRILKDKHCTLIEKLRGDV